MHAFHTYIFCQSWYTLQRGLPAIAGLLVLQPLGSFASVVPWSMQLSARNHTYMIHWWTLVYLSYRSTECLTTSWLFYQDTGRYCRTLTTTINIGHVWLYSVFIDVVTGLHCILHKRVTGKFIFAQRWMDSNLDTVVSQIRHCLILPQWWLITPYSDYPLDVPHTSLRFWRISERFI